MKLMSRIRSVRTNGLHSLLKQMPKRRISCNHLRRQIMNAHAGLPAYASSRLRSAHRSPRPRVDPLPSLLLSVIILVLRRRTVHIPSLRPSMPNQHLVPQRLW